MEQYRSRRPQQQINGNNIDGWYAYDWSAIPAKGVRSTNAGWLKTQTSSAGQNLSYEYYGKGYGNGYVKGITDTSNNSYTKYEYDKVGNRSFEGYTSLIDGQGNREYYQYANLNNWGQTTISLSRLHLYPNPPVKSPHA